MRKHAQTEALGATRVSLPISLQMMNPGKEPQSNRPKIKVIVLRLDGDLVHQGFRVELDVGMEGRPLVPSYKGRLIPMPQLVQQLLQWEQDYRNWGVQRRIHPKEVVLLGSTQQIETCRQSAQMLEDTFLQWLQTPGFLKLDIRLRELVHQDDATLVLLRTESDVIRKLPWHRWNFIDRYFNSELVLSGIQPNLVSQTKPKSMTVAVESVRILAILGDASDIDVGRDRLLLEALPNADVTFLVEPNRTEMNDQLWEQPWDILFFAGHSHTENEQGRIYINPEDSLTLGELTYGLRKAVQQGLQLAIFNSCDGLGLAYELEQLSLPHLIVMREPVPDKVAQAFLTHFLASFAQGNSLYQAVREGRERLQGIENEFPCASWLPVIYQQPLSIPPTWKGFQSQRITRFQVASPLALNEPTVQPKTLTPPPQSQPQSRPRPRLSRVNGAGKIETIIIVVIATIIVTSLIVGMRSLGLFQTLEMRAYDHFMQRRLAPVPDARLLVITVDKHDLDYQDAHHYKRREGWSLSDQALAEVLQTIGPYQPRAVGLDIVHPYPFDSSVPSALNQYNLNLVATCVVGTSHTLADDATPPPGFGFEDGTLGFADFVVDPDGVIRRQLPLMAAGDPCQTSRALSLQLANKYLEKEGLNPIQKLPNGDRVIGGHQSGTQQINARPLKRLRYNSGGYQLHIDQANGYQLLLNYRYSNPITIPLREVLLDQGVTNFSSLVRDRIILIGVNQPQQDIHRTATHKDIPGVMIHAHMVSHFLDIALENKSQVWWWPQWTETIWIALWVTIGSSLVFLNRSYWKLGLSIFTTVMILYGLCWIGFKQDGWIPLIPPVGGIILAAITVAITINNDVLSRPS